jgi:hypothetical protein
MNRSPENVALFDMDGTLCDYDMGLTTEMNRLASPGEPRFSLPIAHDAPPYLKARRDLICGDEDWWANLPRLQLGWNVLQVAQALGYRQMILTQGPRRNPAAWAGKKRWIDQHLGEDFDITVTRDKSLVYGKVLVDDFAGYFEKWLDWRPRGLVIMPVGHMNRDYQPTKEYAKRVIKYDGTNLEEVRDAMEKARHRVA